MISVRRLAREWALKILYQNDVNRSELKETLEGTLDRLRKEFVKRGSKAGSGSLIEEAILEDFTARAAILLPVLTPELETAISGLLKHYFQDSSIWNRVFLNSDMKRNAYKSLLEVPKLLAPSSPSQIFSTLPKIAPFLHKLPVENAVKIKKLEEWLQTELPYLVLNTYAAEINNARPENTLLAEANAFVNEGWRHFGNDMAERWQKIGLTVLKQTSDWLKVAGFAYSLATGTSKEQATIDTSLAELAEGWSPDRQAAVDRNILRLAAYEMLYEDKIPASVAINEAVELAKKYSAAESGRFVNGILGALELKRSGKAILLLEHQVEVSEENTDEDVELTVELDEPDTLETDV